MGEEEDFMDCDGEELDFVDCDGCGIQIDLDNDEYCIGHEEKCQNYGLEEQVVDCECSIFCHPECCPICNPTKETGNGS